ncbi:MAG: putative carboxymuconolactone decarboxylase [Candidatus Angelobacter sp.]|jgi:alkylhydroperoxidase family enzyme|nr:putative carboxymuconolactone decarboxylase [Candidatus Angelobacter sp.]
MQHHLASSKQVGVTPEDWKALKNGPSSGKFTDKELAALAFAEKLTLTPAKINDADVAALKAHFTDAQIVDLDLLIGLINLTNRFTDPMGLELEFPAEKV